MINTFVSYSRLPSDRVYFPDDGSSPHHGQRDNRSVLVRVYFSMDTMPCVVHVLPILLDLIVAVEVHHLYYSGRVLLQNLSPVLTIPHSIEHFDYHPCSESFLILHSYHDFLLQFDYSLSRFVVAIRLVLVVVHLQNYSACVLLLFQ